MSTAEVQQDHPKPRPPKSADVLLSDVLLWRARAFQNRAEMRAAIAEQRAVAAESADMVRRARQEAAGLRTRLKAANARIEELEAGQ